MPVSRQRGKKKGGPPRGLEARHGETLSVKLAPYAKPDLLTHGESGTVKLRNGMRHAICHAHLDDVGGQFFAITRLQGGLLQWMLQGFALYRAY